MESRQYNTFGFFRNHFNVPARQALTWCIIRETTPAGTQLRLGIALKDTRLYIDVAQRRFFSQGDCAGVSRRCFPARRIDRVKAYEYRSEEGGSLTLPKHFIRDIYRSSLFDRQMLSSTLL